MNLDTIVLYGLDLIVASPLVGTDMEVSCVLISFDCVADFGALFPKSKLGIGSARKDRGDDRTQLVFRDRERSVFLNLVKKVDHYSAVSLLLKDVGVLAAPEFQRPSGLFQVCYKARRWVTVLRPTIPGCGNSLSEAGTFGPVVIKPEKLRFGDAGSNMNNERDMIGGPTSHGGKGGVGEDDVSSKINESTVESLEGG